MTGALQAVADLQPRCVQVVMTTFLNAWATASRLHVPGALNVCGFGFSVAADSLRHHVFECPVPWLAVEAAARVVPAPSPMERLGWSDRPAHVLAAWSVAVTRFPSDGAGIRRVRRGGGCILQQASGETC